MGINNTPVRVMFTVAHVFNNYYVCGMKCFQCTDNFIINFGAITVKVPM